VLLLLLAAALALLWPQAPWRDSPPAAGSTASTRAGKGGTPRGRAPEQVGSATAPEATPSGETSITGIVVSLVGKPVPGASLVALRHSAEETLLARAACAGSEGGVAVDFLSCLMEQDQREELFEEARSVQPELVHATSDAQGAFTLSGLREGVYEVWAEAPHGVAVQRIAVGTSGVRLQLEEGILLKGVAQQGGELLVAGATVTLFPRGFLRTFEQLSGADGQFTFGRMPAVEYLVWGRKDGLMPDMTGAGPEEVEWLTLSLSAPAVLEGRVVRQGRGVPGVEVRASGMLESLTTVTDAQGHFTLHGARQSYYELEARTGQEIAVGSTHLEGGGPTEPVILELERCAGLEGRVTAGAERPLADAVVFVANEEQSWEVSTDAAGRYGLECIRSGPFLVSVDARGFQPQQVTQGQQSPLAPGERRTLHWMLQEAAVFDGQVVDTEGRGIEGAFLLLVSEDQLEPSEDAPTSEVAGETDAEGRFSIDGLAPKAYLLTIEVPEGLESHSERVEVPRSGARFVMKRPAPRPGIVVGTVVDEQGQPLEDIVVEAQPRRDGADVFPVSSVRTNAAGQFRLQQLALGAWDIFASRQGVHLQAEVSTSKGVEIGGPEPVVIELRLASGLTVSGLVVDERGAPVPQASVMALRTVAGEPPRQGGVTETDAAGHFSLRHLEAGDLLLEARPMDRERTPLRMAMQQARAGDTGVRIVLPPLRQLSGRVLSEEGTPVPEFSVQGHFFSDPGGRYTLHEEVPGLFRFVFTAEGFAPTLREVRLRADADAVLPDVVLKRGRPVRGRVLDGATGKGLADVEVRLLSGQGPPNGGLEDLWRTMTEGDGSFHATALEPGTTLLALHPEYGLARVKVPEGSGELVIRLETGTGAPEPEEP
jgi:protocatechuate 3,4-dioxygenase beta subunit